MRRFRRWQVARNLKEERSIMNPRFITNIAG
jgi:hypothetical protein